MRREDEIAERLERQEITYLSGHLHMREEAEQDVEWLVAIARVARSALVHMPNSAVRDELRDVLAGTESQEVLDLEQA